nr:uncharacterized protein LOC113827065 [Penaeus vannamei]
MVPFQEILMKKASLPKFSSVKLESFLCHPYPWASDSSLVWVNMNALTVISVAILVASGSASLLAYSGVYGGHHGLLGAYPYAGYSGVVPYAYAGGLPAAAPLSLKTPVIKTLAPTPISYNVAPAPVSYNVAPAPVSYNVVPFAPVAPVQSQYHAQDEIGQYSFGYAGGPSSRAESRDAFGVVRGSYNYVDSEGKVQTQHYVADALGFRASGTNLPVAPDAPLAALPAPSPNPSRTLLRPTTKPPRRRCRPRHPLKSVLETASYLCVELSPADNIKTLVSFDRELTNVYEIPLNKSFFPRNLNETKHHYPSSAVSNSSLSCVMKGRGYHQLAGAGLERRSRLLDEKIPLHYTE